MKITMKINLTIALLGVLILVSQCTPKKSPIDYGLDKCEYCRMAIVDKRFGAEIVTSKGKVYKFDATECMVNFIHSEDMQAENISMLLTNTYDKPGELVEVEQCYFLRSKQMPSPMGMYINPFAQKNLAMQYQSEQNGEIYQWSDLKQKVPSGFN